MKSSSFFKYIRSTIAILVLCTIFLTGCAKENKIEVVGVDLFKDKNTGVTYKVAPASYEAMAVTDELYASVGNAKLYKIDGADPEKWLSESTGSVFYAEDIELPSLAEMDVAYAEILLDGVTLATLDNEFTLAKISAIFIEEESFSRPMVATYEINWRVRFADESLGLYYTLAYVEISEDYIVENSDGTTTNYGRKFLFDRHKDICVMAGDVFDSYVAEYKALNQA